MNTEKDSTKVLITGGSGFLGINLVRYLFSKGVCNIRTLDLSDFDYPERPRIEHLQGDIRSKSDVEMALRDVSIVVHSAAALPLYQKSDIFETEIQGTRNLLEASLRNKVDRFIHISSTAVYGVPDHHPLMEDDRLEGVGPYGEAKILAENVCREFREKGLCIPVLRPKSFVGPERLGVFALLYEWARDGKNFPLIGRGQNRYQLLDVEDLCGAIFQCMFDPAERVNDVFNIGAKDFRTLKEDFQAVLDRAGYGKKIVCFPEAPAIAFLKIMERLRLSPLYMWIYETVYQDSFVSVEKAERVFGFSPKFSNQDALLRNYEWFLKNSDQFRNRTGISHRVPWKAGALQLLKFFF